MGRRRQHRHRRRSGISRAARASYSTDAATNSAKATGSVANVPRMMLCSVTSSPRTVPPRASRRGTGGSRRIRNSRLPPFRLRERGGFDLASNVLRRNAVVGNAAGILPPRPHKLLVGGIVGSLPRNAESQVCVRGAVVARPTRRPLLCYPRAHESPPIPQWRITRSRSRGVSDARTASDGLDVRSHDCA